MQARNIIASVLLLAWSTHSSACTANRPMRSTPPDGGEKAELPLEQVAAVEPIVALAAGTANTCAILERGALRCWGRGDRGVTGLGRSDDIGDDETPASVGDVDIGGRVEAVTIGDARACAILVGGRLRCWGRSWGSDEIIGDDEPASAAAIVDFGRPVRQIALAAHHACVVLDDGSVRCWGLNYEGRIGNGRLGVPRHDDVFADADAASVPAVELGFGAVDVEVHADGTCALAANGAVRCWGDRRNEQVGYVAGTISCTSCDASPSCCIGYREHPATFGDLPLGLPASQLSMYAANACAVVAGGGVRCWGAHPHGLGYPELLDRAQPAQDLPTPAQLGDQDWGEPIREVAVAHGKVCTLAVSGRVRCWGHDPLLRPLGVPAPLERAPAEFIIDLGHPARALAGGDHVCALLETGTIRCWGGSDHGQLGYANRHIVGDDESPASMGDVDVAGVLEPAISPRAPDTALLERLAAAHLILTPVEIDGAVRHHASLDGPAPEHIAELVDLLTKVETLRSLDLRAAGLRDLEEIGRLTRLTRLDVSGNPLDSLEPLQRMKELAQLDISETRVEDLRGLRTLTGLVRLRAANTPLRHVNELYGFNKLLELDLEYTLVKPDDSALESLRTRAPELQLRL
jgi:hypothetical protein